MKKAIDVMKEYPQLTRHVLQRHRENGKGTLIKHTLWFSDEEIQSMLTEDKTHRPHKEGYLSTLDVVEEFGVPDGTINRYRDMFHLGHKAGMSFFYTREEAEKIYKYWKEPKKWTLKKDPTPEGYISLLELKASSGLSRQTIFNRVHNLNVGHKVKGSIYLTLEEAELVKNYAPPVREKKEKPEPHRKKIPDWVWSAPRIAKEYDLTIGTVNHRIEKLGLLSTKIDGRLYLNDDHVQMIVNYKPAVKPKAAKVYKTVYKPKVVKPKVEKPKAIKPKVVKPKIKNFWKLSIYSEQLYGYVVKCCGLSKEDAIDIETSLIYLGFNAKASPCIKAKKVGRPVTKEIF